MFSCLSSMIIDWFGHPELPRCLFLSPSLTLRLLQIGKHSRATKLPVCISAFLSQNPPFKWSHGLLALIGVRVLIAPSVIFPTESSLIWFFFSFFVTVFSLVCLLLFFRREPEGSRNSTWTLLLFSLWLFPWPILPYALVVLTPFSYFKTPTPVICQAFRTVYSSARATRTSRPQHGWVLPIMQLLAQISSLLIVFLCSLSIQLNCPLTTLPGFIFFKAPLSGFSLLVN